VLFATVGAALVFTTAPALSRSPEVQARFGIGLLTQASRFVAYWREENYGANAIAQFYYDPASLVGHDSDAGCERQRPLQPISTAHARFGEPVEDNLNFPVERPASAGAITSYPRRSSRSRDRRPDPLPDNGLVIAIRQ